MSIVEFRQYTLRPGARETLIELFEREFVTGQQAVGITVGGRFRDLDDPDRFVWLRAFPDMAHRRRALEAFYTGPVWREHRDVANATMIDSDDVLLLRGPGFELEPGLREVPATICHPRTRRPSPRTPPNTCARTTPCTAPSTPRTTTRSCRSGRARTSDSGSARPRPHRGRPGDCAWHR